MTSIRRWLLGWLIFGLAATSLAAGYGIFHTARKEASELFDYELRTVALSMPSNIATADAGERRSHDFNSLADDRIAIDIWDKQGQLVYHSLNEPALPRLAGGFRSIERDAYRWRVFGLQQPDRFIQVAQPFSVREDLALRLAWRTLWPLALVVPVTIGLVLFVVGRGLAPIGGLSRALSRRSIDSLDPLHSDARVPEEIRPLVDALNDLLRRLNDASQAQRIFVADAAHELRTPLAALKLQLQAARRDGTLQGDGQVLERLEGRLNRIIHLAHQLLTMAREDANRAASVAPMSLRRLAETSVSDLSLLAEARHIDLGLEAQGDGSDDYAVLGDHHALGILLNNLIDNAIRHTPESGKVDVVLMRDERGVGLDVVDTGAGIAPEELARVFDRFYRGAGAQGSGSGLGLAIASSIAARHRATLDVSNLSEAGGLSLRLRGLAPGSAAAPAELQVRTPT
jgi:two-component system, OmpR family, sensor kinase